MNTRLMTCAALLACALLATGCTVIDRTRETQFDASARWVLLPMVNHTETPQAGLRAESVTEALLRSAGVVHLERYPTALNADGLFDPAERKAQDQALVWAKARKARFAVSGAVDEWRYKVGVDGEPAVGITLTIVDLDSDAVVYAAAGGKSGWSREALSAVARNLIRELLAGVRLSK